MIESAYKWGLRHKACPEALAEREALGPEVTQADWWLACRRGDWMLWELRQLPAIQRELLLPALDRAMKVIVRRAIWEHCRRYEIPTVEEWTAEWLAGGGSWREAAVETARVTVSAAQWAESRRQADDIRAEIPVWPEEAAA